MIVYGSAQDVIYQLFAEHLWQKIAETSFDYSKAKIVYSCYFCKMEADLFPLNSNSIDILFYLSNDSRDPSTTWRQVTYLTCDQVMMVEALE